MKKKLALILFSIIIATLTLLGCSKQVSETQTSPKSDKITVTDSSGAKVEVPTNISRIADAWGAHNAVVAMLGSGDKIVATTLNAKLKPWLFKVTPKMNNAVTTFNVDATNINMEELIKTKPDILFMSTGNKNISKMSDLKIPVVQVSFKDFDSMKKCVKLTGDILGEEGKKRAQQYVSYLDNKINMISSVTSKIPEDQKLKVLHIADFSPLKVDGKDTIIDSWIKVSGGINAAGDVSGNAKEVSMEQILTWNPDVIIVSSTVGNADRKKSLTEILNDETWKKTNAVQKGRVYVNPDGAFSWDRYSAEEALQIQWVAKTLYPEKFQSLDVGKETKWFYKTFFNYSLSDSEVQRILNGQPPQ
ncbi:ABC transporter substrate-binding protein [Clostridium sp. WILCCON 0269]|uniref:ABC transporter substrate-binding protein n=1 Tax=Candidatus Clostridium eludens TaxID=3381663 RepID=A0ABW8SGN1_9CLOT